MADRAPNAIVWIWLWLLLACSGACRARSEAPPPAGKLPAVEVSPRVDELPASEAPPPVPEPAPTQIPRACIEAIADCTEVNEGASEAIAYCVEAALVVGDQQALIPRCREATRLQGSPTPNSTR